MCRNFTGKLYQSSFGMLPLADRFAHLQPLELRIISIIKSYVSVTCLLVISLIVSIGLFFLRHVSSPLHAVWTVATLESVILLNVLFASKSNP